VLEKSFLFKKSACMPLSDSDEHHLASYSGARRCSSVSKKDLYLVLHENVKWQNCCQTGCWP